MARTNLKAISVYVDEHQYKVLVKLAVRENRSLSNLLLTLGLERAEEPGIESHGTTTRTKKAAGGR